MKIQDGISSAQPSVMSRRLFLNIGTAATAASLLAACSGGDNTAAAATPIPTVPNTPNVPSKPIETCTPGNNTFTVEAGKSITVSLTEIYADDRGNCYVQNIGGNPQHGTITFANGYVTYTSYPGYTGSDTFVVTYTDGHTSTITVNVTAPNAPDTTPPTITLNGANPMTLTVGTAYAEPGASWTDNKDGSGVVTTISGTVGATVGSYTITYTRSDAAGNIGTATRTVNVVSGYVTPTLPATLPDISVGDNGGINPVTFAISMPTALDVNGNQIPYNVAGLPTTDGFGTPVTWSKSQTGATINISGLYTGFAPGTTYTFPLTITSSQATGSTATSLKIQAN